MKRNNGYQIPKEEKGGVKERIVRLAFKLLPIALTALGLCISLAVAGSGGPPGKTTPLWY